MNEQERDCRGVLDNILNKPLRMVNGRPERKLGHDFASIGLSKTLFAPVFEPLRSSVHGILQGY